MRMSISRARKNARASTRSLGLASSRWNRRVGEITLRGPPAEAVSSVISLGRSSIIPKTPLNSAWNSPRAGSSGMTARV